MVLAASTPPASPTFPLASDEAMPALREAERSLRALNKNDISEVRALKKPPAGVVLVIEAICIAMGVAPNRVRCVLVDVMTRSSGLAGGAEGGTLAQPAQHGRADPRRIRGRRSRQWLLAGGHPGRT